MRSTAISNRNPPPGARRARAFSLLEVVVAVGIFAAGMIAVVGLFTPVARSVGNSADAEAASRVADALRAKLQSMAFLEVAGLLKNSTAAGHALSASDARSDYDPAADPQILFATRDATLVGTTSDPIWRIDVAAGQIASPNKFFEIALIRNEAISPHSVAAVGNLTTPPPSSDETACLLAYTARIRWPASVSESAAAGAGGGRSPAGGARVDASVKQVMFFTGSIAR